MKRISLMWTLAAVITIAYIATMIFVRVGSTTGMQHKLYRQWQQEYVMQESGNQAFINTSNDRSNPVALSEGQGYGMYLTAIAGGKGWATQQNFDDLLNFYLEHRDVVGEHRDTETYLMQWKLEKNNQTWKSHANSATDGDLYIAYSLHLASSSWPSRRSYYQSIERKLIGDILAYEYNTETHTLTVGNWADKQSEYYNLMRTSDVMPTFFEAFHTLSGDARWSTVNNAMLDRMVNLSDQQQTGLLPDFAWVTDTGARPVKGKTVATKFDGDYSSNACRTPMMLASSDDSRAGKVVSKLLKFFESQETITAGYSLAGNRLNDYTSNSFTAPLTFAANLERFQGYSRLKAYRQSMLSETLTTTNYYDATLTVMAVMGDNH